jgi:hypothetical protein
MHLPGNRLFRTRLTIHRESAGRNVPFRAWESCSIRPLAIRLRGAPIGYITSTPPHVSKLREDETSHSPQLGRLGFADSCGAVSLITTSSNLLRKWQ